MQPSVFALLRSFRVVALLEGVSYVLLLGVAMPLKYWAGVPIAVRVVGSLHGALFVAYAICAGLLWLRGQWTFGRASAAMGVSLVPLATFFFDRSIRAELAARASTGRRPAETA
jgi:integral membrane protein